MREEMQRLLAFKFKSVSLQNYLEGIIGKTLQGKHCKIFHSGCCTGRGGEARAESMKGEARAESMEGEAGKRNILINNKGWKASKVGDHV